MAGAIQHSGKRNREILKCCIDIISLGIRGRSRRMKNRDNYECSLLEVSDCEPYRQLLLNHDTRKIDIINDAFNYLQRRRVLNHLVDAITMALKTEILNEVRESTYVSIMLSEHLVNHEIAQISTVLRYVKDCAVRETFIGFRNLHRSSSYVDTIKSHISEIIKEYEISEKFLAISVDGNVLSRIQLTTLLLTVKSQLNCSYFVPWYFHGFGRVLMQSASCFKECEMFFKTFSAMETFFTDKSNVLEKKIKSEQWIKKNLSKATPFIVTLSANIKFFTEMLKNVLTLPKLLHAKDFVKAVVFQKHLKEMEIVFLIKYFRRMFWDYFDSNYNFHLDKLRGILRAKQFSNEKFSDYVEYISDAGKNHFSLVWNEAKREVFTAKKAKMKHSSEVPEQVMEPDDREYNSLFTNLSEHVDAEVNFRLEDMTRLAFCDLLNCSTGGLTFDRELLSKLRSEQHLSFDHNAVESEIQKMESEKDLLSNKTIYELPELFTKSAPQLKKLAELVLTLPYLPPSRSIEDSKVQQIGCYSYLPTATDFPSGEISVLCLGQSILENFKRSELFHDNVLSKFSKLNSDIKLDEV